MSDSDIRLTAALNADPPPERDPKFRVEVLFRAERARFKRRLVMTLAIALVAASLMAWLAVDTWNFWLVATAAAVAMFFLSGVPIEAIPGVSVFARIFRRWLFD